VKWFQRSYKIIEVERPRTSPEDLPELREGLKALGANPYFAWLLGRLKAQRNFLETRLKESRFDKIEDVSFVQGGVFWTGWLQREVERLTLAPPRAELTPEQEEIEAFQQIDALLTRVGLDNEVS
jgi:hypothetical protein